MAQGLSRLQAPIPTRLRPMCEAPAVNYGMLPRRPDEALPGVCPIMAGYGAADRRCAERRGSRSGC